METLSPLIERGCGREVSNYEHQIHVRHTSTTVSTDTFCSVSVATQPVMYTRFWYQPVPTWLLDIYIAYTYSLLPCLYQIQTKPNWSLASRTALVWRVLELNWKIKLFIPWFYKMVGLLLINNADFQWRFYGFHFGISWRWGALFNTA